MSDSRFRVPGRRGRLVLAVVLLAVAAGCTAEPDPTVEERIDAAVGELLDSDPAFDNLRAVAVSVDGETVFEEYYGTSPDVYWPVQSVTKSVVGTLVGIAVDQGL